MATLTAATAAVYSETQRTTGFVVQTPSSSKYLLMLSASIGVSLYQCHAKVRLSFVFYNDTYYTVPGAFSMPWLQDWTLVSVEFSTSDKGKVYTSSLRETPSAGRMGRPGIFAASLPVKLAPSAVCSVTVVLSTAASTTVCGALLECSLRLPLASLIPTTSELPVEAPAGASRFLAVAVDARLCGGSAAVDTFPSIFLGKAFSAPDGTVSNRWRRIFSNSERLAPPCGELDIVASGFAAPNHTSLEEPVALATLHGGSVTPGSAPSLLLCGVVPPAAASGVQSNASVIVVPVVQLTRDVAHQLAAAAACSAEGSQIVMLGSSSAAPNASSTVAVHPIAGSGANAASPPSVVHSPFQTLTVAVASKALSIAAAAKAGVHTNIVVLHESPAELRSGYPSTSSQEVDQLELLLSNVLCASGVARPRSMRVVGLDVNDANLMQRFLQLTEPVIVSPVITSGTDAVCVAGTLPTLLPFGEHIHVPVTLIDPVPTSHVPLTLSGMVGDQVVQIPAPIVNVLADLDGVTPFAAAAAAAVTVRTAPRGRLSSELLSKVFALPCGPYAVFLADDPVSIYHDGIDAPALLLADGAQSPKHPGSVVSAGTLGTSKASIVLPQASSSSWEICQSIVEEILSPICSVVSMAEVLAYADGSGLWSLSRGIAAALNLGDSGQLVSSMPVIDEAILLALTEPRAPPKSPAPPQKEAETTAKAPTAKLLAVLSPAERRQYDAQVDAIARKRELRAQAQQQRLADQAKARDVAARRTKKDEKNKKKPRGKKVEDDAEELAGAAAAEAAAAEQQAAETEALEAAKAALLASKRQIAAGSYWLSARVVAFLETECSEQEHVWASLIAKSKRSITAAGLQQLIPAAQALAAQR